MGNLTELLVAAREFEEAQSLAREKLPAIIDRHGSDHTLTLEVRTWYARALFLEGEDLSEPERIHEDVWRRSRRVLGDSHPDTERARKFLEEVRSARADAAEEHAAAGLRTLRFQLTAAYTPTVTCVILILSGSAGGPRVSSTSSPSVGSASWALGSCPTP